MMPDVPKLLLFPKFCRVHISGSAGSRFNQQCEINQGSLELPIHKKH
jgi:hypothetical protein